MGVRRVQDLGKLGDVDEHHQIWFPTVGRVADAPLMIYVHGTAANGWSGSETGASALRLAHPCKSLARFMVVEADYDFDADPNVQAVRGTWGTDESMSGITRVINAVGAAYGVNTNQVAIWGDSAGGASALGYLWRNPTKVAAVQIHQGAVDIQAVRDLNNPLINFLIDQAYHGNWAAAAATHDPADNTSLLDPYSDRIRLWYTTGDGLVPTQPTLDFADAIGCERVCMGTGDHGTGDIFSHAESTNWFADRMGI